MKRSWVLAAVIAVGACSKKEEGKPAQPARAAAGGDASAPLAEKPPPAGPVVLPVQSEAVAFVVPKADTKWWGELNFSCYRAVMSLTGTRTPGEAFEKLSPTVPGAMAVAGVDLGRDLAALGAFDCGDTPCIYAVTALAKPDKMPELLAKLLPGIPQQTVAPGHYTLATPGSRGTRTIHVRVVPLHWARPPRGDAWNVEASKATHVVFIGGVDGKNLDVDPLTRLADEASAKDNVADAEEVLADKRGRCLLGRVGPTGFQPGYKLDRARFALAAPSGRSDAFTELLGSTRTVELVVELFLTPAPKQADVEQWIESGRAWMSRTAAPVRMQFAGNPMLDVFLDMASVLGERGFKYELRNKAVRFTWRTDRVPRAELEALERRFQALGGTP